MLEDPLDSSYEVWWYYNGEPLWYQEFQTLNAAKSFVEKNGGRNFTVVEKKMLSKLA